MIDSYDPAEEQRMQAEWLIKHGLTPRALEQAVYTGIKAVHALMKKHGLDTADIKTLRKRWNITTPTTNHYRKKAKSAAQHG